MNAQDVRAAIVTFLTSKHLPPTEQWLDTIVPTLKLNTPLLGQQKTALFRMLASDLVSSVTTTPTMCFPPSLSDPGTRSLVCTGPIITQVVDIEDVGRSRWSQVEAMEMEERGETTKGREIIRNLPADETSTEQSTPTTTSSGPHKLLLQDAKGQRLYALELEPINGISVNMSIGSKLVLRAVEVARGMLLLTPATAEVLGGKIDAWDRSWRAERKQVLKEKSGMTDSFRNG